MRTERQKKWGSTDVAIPPKIDKYINLQQYRAEIDKYIPKSVSQAYREQKGGY